MAVLTNEQIKEALHIVNTSDTSEMLNYLIGCLSSKDSSILESKAFVEVFLNGFWSSAEITKHLLKTISKK